MFLFIYHFYRGSKMSEASVSPRNSNSSGAEVCVWVLPCTNVLRIRSRKKAVKVQSTQDTKFLASLCHPCVTKLSFPSPAQQTHLKMSIYIYIID